jgi:hypothetical protein
MAETPLPEVLKLWAERSFGKSWNTFSAIAVERTGKFQVNCLNLP